MRRRTDDREISGSYGNREYLLSGTRQPRNTSCTGMGTAGQSAHTCSRSPARAHARAQLNQTAVADELGKALAALNELVRARARTHEHIHKHAQTHTHTRAHTGTRTRTHMHTRTHEHRH